MKTKKIKAGEPFARTMRMVDDRGVVVDLTGLTVKSGLRQYSETRPTTIYEPLIASVPNPSSGEVFLTAPATETLTWPTGGRLRGDILFEDSSGATVAYSATYDLIVEPSITEK